MLLWLVFAGMSAVVIAAVLRPLLRTADTTANVSTGHAAATTAVYRDQLTEIDAERQRGLIGVEEAEAARVEIGRRLLASVPAPTADANAGVRAGPPSPSSMPRRLAAVVAVIMPVAAIAIYAAGGAPGIPSQPIAARRTAPPVHTDIEKLVTAVEKRLREHPEDGRGWDVVAPVYFRMTRYAAAADAYGRAIALLGETPARLAGLAEAAMLASGGDVTPAARSALEKLLKLEPGHVQARFWLAFAKEQDGRLAEAAADYARLLAEAPSDASWRPMLEERHAAIRTEMAEAAEGKARPGADAAAKAAAQPGPTASDIAAAERLSPGDRQAMIDGMVSGLAARLEKDGRDLVGWQRLIRALTVLGRKEEATAALGRAQKSFAGEAQALADLAELAKTLGLGS